MRTYCTTDYRIEPSAEKGSESAMLAGFEYISIFVILCRTKLSFDIYSFVSYNKKTEFSIICCLSSKWKRKAFMFVLIPLANPSPSSTIFVLNSKVDWNLKPLIKRATLNPEPEKTHTGLAQYSPRTFRVFKLFEELSD